MTFRVLSIILRVVYIHVHTCIYVNFGDKMLLFYRVSLKLVF